MTSDVKNAIAMTVIGGYLGAGKTTLLNRLLAEADESIAVIVNDFGSINIDASLIDSADDSTIALTNGCVCCSLTDGLVDALAVVKDLDPTPDRVVVETSGVADPATVAAYGTTPGYFLDAVIVLADAAELSDQISHHLVGDLVRTQLRGADLIVLNKMDLIDESARRRLEDLLVEEAPRVASVATTHALVPPAVLLGARLSSHTTDAKVPAREIDHDALWKTWTNRAEQPLSRDQIESLVESFPPGVVRGKGAVWLSEEPATRWVFQLVGSRWTLEAAGDWIDDPVTELVFIATRD